MTAGGKEDASLCHDYMGLDDPNFGVSSHGGFCVVRVHDSLSVVVINNDNYVEVEVYERTEDDAPIDSMVFRKEDYNNDE
tara:strand:- start:351 stop:590 length:240 start_codon:yes stop_codon:yes gene_type:complete